MILKIILSLIAIIFLWLVFVYNKLIRLKNQVKEAWADIEVQLKRRYNLIPNLVETVKGYAWHEKEVLTKVTEARSKAIKADSLEEKAKAENFLTQTLKSDSVLEKEIDVFSSVPGPEYSKSVGATISLTLNSVP